LNRFSKLPQNTLNRPTFGEIGPTHQFGTRSFLSASNVAGRRESLERRDSLHQKQIWSGLALVIIASVGSYGCGGGGSNPSSTTSGTTANAGKFVQTNLVADTAGKATYTDPNLVDAWGISYSPSGPFWISDNGTGLSTVYNGSGIVQNLVVTIPPGTGTNPPAAASGNVYNATSSFIIPGSTKAVFMFDTEDGAISAWNSGAAAIKVVDNGATGAVYKGLAIDSYGGADYVYAANLNSGLVERYDTNFTLQGTFTDTGLPAGYAPFGIENINGLLYVTFALQNALKHDDTPGAGFGYVDVFNPNGTLVKQLVSRGVLNAPWGLAVAPTGFGSLSGDLLVGNFGDGRINAYNLSSGTFVGTLNNASGTPLSIDGLWGLIFGNGGSAGSTSTLYFTAGPNAESHGLFGTINPSP
jgi:uncharacterized protein (TIGR03118 family)